MDIVSTILSAAKVAKVSGILLLAICAHESNNFTMTYTPDDKGSPSYGACQIKYETAKLVGFRGNPTDLNNLKTNARYAALYLRYQQIRYGESDWCVITASYNSGSYLESREPGYPQNLRYVRLVQRKLPEDFRDRLSCGNRDIAKN